MCFSDSFSGPRDISGLEQQKIFGQEMVPEPLFFRVSSACLISLNPHAPLESGPSPASTYRRGTVVQRG